MSTPHFRSRFSLVGTVVVSLLAAPANASDPAGSPPEAARLVIAALQAEQDGDNQTRRQLLTQALGADPEYAPAHWQSGAVPVNESSGGDFQKAAPVPGGWLSEYRDLRSETARASQTCCNWPTGATRMDCRTRSGPT